MQTDNNNMMMCDWKVFSEEYIYKKKSAQNSEKYLKKKNQNVGHSISTRHEYFNFAASTTTILTKYDKNKTTTYYETKIYRSITPTYCCRNESKQEIYNRKKVKYGVLCFGIISLYK